MGNRIFGCDDCQLCCPWNKFAQATDEGDFRPRHGLADAELVELLLWDEKTFLAKTAGSAIRRIGYQRWLRNVAVALGNAGTAETRPALERLAGDEDAVVREHAALLGDHYVETIWEIAGDVSPADFPLTDLPD